MASQNEENNDQHSPNGRADNTGNKGLAADLGSVARNIWLAGLGAVAAVEEESNRAIKTAVSQGEKLREKSQELRTKGELGAWNVLDGITESVQKIEGDVSRSVDEKVNKLYKAANIASANEYDTLSERIDQLTLKVQRLKEKMAGKDTSTDVEK